MLYGARWRYKLIRRIKISTASEHDTQHFEAVIDPGHTSRDMYADKGYVDGEREARLKWRMHIQRRGSKDKPLSQAQRNKRIAKPRATLHLNWKAAAYNLQRFSYLKQAKIVAF